jgi:transcriptional regulator NrdR family protein
VADPHPAATHQYTCQSQGTQGLRDSVASQAFSQQIRRQRSSGDCGQRY